MLNERYPESKQNKSPFLGQQSQSHRPWPRNVKRYMCLHYRLIVISGALSTGKQNYFKKFTDDERTSYLYHLHNLHHNYPHIAYAISGLMTYYCWVFEFLRRSVEGNHLKHFESENAVFKILQRSVEARGGTPI